MKKKSFDCVAMKHRGSRKIYEETKDLTLEQELKYWRRKTEALLRLQSEPKAAGGGQ
jgi:hypothetical protein